MKLSPAFWSTLAVVMTTATLYEGFCLTLWQPAFPYSRITFALYGFLAVLCWKHETILRRPRRVSGRAFGIGVARCCAGALGLALLAALIYPIFAKARGGRAFSPASNLKQIWLGYAQYAQDHDNRLPQTGTANETRAALYPYLKNPSLWRYEQKGKPAITFVPNPVVLGHTLDAFPVNTFGEKEAVLAYSDGAITTDDGSHYVVFVDGRVKWLPEKRFQIMLVKTASQVANAPIPYVSRRNPSP